MKTPLEVTEQLSRKLEEIRLAVLTRMDNTVEAMETGRTLHARDGAVAHMLGWSGELFELSAKLTVYSAFLSDFQSSLGRPGTPADPSELLLVRIERVQAELIENAGRGAWQSSAPTSDLMEKSKQSARSKLVAWVLELGSFNAL